MISGARKGSDALFGTQRWNRLFSVPLSNKGGKLNHGRAIKGKEDRAAVLEEPSQSREREGDGAAAA